MELFRYRKFPVYVEAKKLEAVIFSITDLQKITSQHKDQIRRAALSISLNIAEGSSKISDKEFARFLEISISSANEVASCLESMVMQKQISLNDYNTLIDRLKSIVMQLGGFIKKLRS